MCQGTELGQRDNGLTTPRSLPCVQYATFLKSCGVRNEGTIDTPVESSRMHTTASAVHSKAAANEPEIKSLAQRALKHFFASNPERAYRV